MATDKWISVDERLPEFGDQTWVFADGDVDVDWYEGGRGDIALDCEGEFKKSGWYAFSHYEITHWMPLERPLPPNETN